MLIGSVNEMTTREDVLKATEANPSLFEIVCLFPLANKVASTLIEEVLLFDEEDEFLSDSDIIL